MLDANAVNKNGGGAYCGKGSDVRFVRCAFTNNTADKGGGVLAVGSKPVLIDCVFTGNSAHYSGGGVFAAKGSAPILRSCRFESNRAVYQGGGVCSLESAGEVLDSSFARNRAGNRGGALYLGFRTSMTASACEFVSTTDSVVGGEAVARGVNRVGACELSRGICVESEEEECVDAGGVFRGHGTVCPVGDAPQHAPRKGDLNADGDVDRSDLGILMLLWR